MNKTDLLRTIEASGFIFKGKVVAHRAAHGENRREFEDRAIRVLIEQVLRGTEATRALVGKEATVVRAHADAPPEGAVRLFFTHCASLGNTILLRGIAEEDVSASALREFAEALEEVERRPLLRRVEAADLIITGKVVESKPAEKRESRSSEHDPLWQRARVAVHSVLKGDKAAKEVGVLFAGSDDIAWRAAPKLREGTSGILLLQRVKPKESKETRDALPAFEGLVYLVIDSLDHLSNDWLPAVQRALGQDREER